VTRDDLLYRLGKIIRELNSSGYDHLNERVIRAEGVSAATLIEKLDRDGLQIIKSP
jgi:hypothetical protein